MLTEQWYTGLVAGIIAANLLVTYQLYRVRRGRGAGRNADDAGSGTIDREEGVVACPACGTENELGYRYCRSCVAELPGAGNFDRAGSTPSRQMTR